jgi:hypothetical protein
MTKDQILQLIKEHFKEGGIRDDGSCSEYYGDLDTFMEFAEKMYNQGRYDGYESGYDAAFCEHGGY